MALELRFTDSLSGPVSATASERPEGIKQNAPGLYHNVLYGPIRGVEQGGAVLELNKVIDRADQLLQ